MPEGVKTPIELRMPWKKAATATRARKGNMICVRRAISSWWSEEKSEDDPGREGDAEGDDDADEEDEDREGSGEELLRLLVVPSAR